MRHNPTIGHATAGLLLALPVAAVAHPGEHHGGFASLAHLLTEPDHLAMILGAVAVGVFIYRKVRHQRARQRRDQGPDQRP